MVTVVKFRERVVIKRNEYARSHDILAISEQPSNFQISIFVEVLDLLVYTNELCDFEFLNQEFKNFEFGSMVGSIFFQ